MAQLIIDNALLKNTSLSKTQVDTLLKMNAGGVHSLRDHLEKKALTNVEDLLAEVLRAGVRGYVLKSDNGQNLLAAVEAISARKPYFSATISETLLEHFVKCSLEGENVATLTPREREIVQLIAEGKINKQIAHLLDISVKTVETHRSSAMHKLKLDTTADLVRYAIHNNIIEP